MVAHGTPNTLVFSSRQPRANGFAPLYTVVCSLCPPKVQKTMTDQLSGFVNLAAAMPSLHKHREHIGFSRGGFGAFENFKKSRNYLHRGYLEIGSMFHCSQHLRFSEFLFAAVSFCV